MTSNEIRSLWIKYFEEHGHKYVESAPLIPRDDNSLLWINAGVTPLKKYFDGTVIPESRRIVNIQKEQGYDTVIKYLHKTKGNVFVLMI